MTEETTTTCIPLKLVVRADSYKVVVGMKACSGSLIKASMFNFRDVCLTSKEGRSWLIQALRHASLGISFRRETASAILSEFNFTRPLAP